MTDELGIEKTLKLSGVANATLFAWAEMGGLPPVQ